MESWAWAAEEKMAAESVRARMEGVRKVMRVSADGG
jgi:hypothetical protein